ncbi:hypothetical protein Acr_25g0002040 [Actinidia rufa]|uniref:Uncharacterized protein n=1 Tax=Actinidia rufa TaxID=165716 RepID=A0A7J0GY87_9ERIC|nr:hypothetical protein Acr_25g0002040 [Actinidia rufa]
MDEYTWQNFWKVLADLYGSSEFSPTSVFQYLGKIGEELADLYASSGLYSTRIDEYTWPTFREALVEFYASSELYPTRIDEYTWHNFRKVLTEFYASSVLCPTSIAHVYLNKNLKGVNRALCEFRALSHEDG